MNRDDFTIDVAATNGRPQRLVVIARTDGTEFRDHVDTNSSVSRQRLRNKAAGKFGIAAAELEWLEDEVITAADEADARADAAASDGDSKERKSQATQLVDLAQGAELFHDPDREAFARFEVDGHFEVAGVRTKHFRRWLGRMFYLTTGKAPSSQATQDAIGVLEGKAIFAGEQRSTHVRVAGRDGKIYVDLCNDEWQVVEVSASGWQVLDQSPVMFRRAKAMLPLPVPTRGGRIAELRQLINITDEDWVLFTAWLVASLRPTGPYPVLDVQGEHGSGKSTACRMARALVDPNTAMVRSEPREPRDIMIASKNGWIIALDNLSGIQAWQSDCLCRLSTGGGFSTRTLYENDEETIFDAQRPVIINGIDEVATRADLLDRCLMVNLPRIEPVARRPESELWRDFETARPRILGALLSAVAMALRNIGTTKLSTLPRMADFALWATAAEPALDLAPGQFIVAYSANRAAGNEMALEASPIGKAVVDFVEEIGAWTGSFTDLLQELDRRADENTKRLKPWPKTARTLSGAVRRLAPNLREAGIGVEFGHHGRGRQRRRCVMLTRKEAESSDPNDPTVPTSEKLASNGDGGVEDAWRGDADQSNGDDPGSQNRIDVTPYAATAGTHGDAGDAKIPTHSPEPEWTEV